MTLMEPFSVSSQDGILHTSLHLMAATHAVLKNSGLSSPAFEITSRLFNGTFPGPLLRLKPGDKLILDYYNELDPAGKPHHHNQYSAPNESNLHFHGLHASGELPSDDSTYYVGPMTSYQYTTDLPVDHMPGTHFIHPHRHGSTALQTAGGAAAAIIVEDDPETSVLPPQILQAREVLLIFQEIQHSKLKNIAKKSDDNLYSMHVLEDESDGSSSLDVTKNKLYLANGQLNPTITIKPNEWVRLRIIHSGWQNGRLDIQIPGCDMQLIAKDGVYLPILPRKIDKAELVNAGRADIMVQCSFDEDGVDRHPITGNTGKNRPVATLVKDETSTSAKEQQGPIPTTRMEFPAYLQDLRNTPATPGCSCETNVGKLKYSKVGPTPTILEQEDAFFHQTYQGAIVERRLSAGSHPYHQHVHPFQIVSGGNSNYYQNGDWHDTIEGTRVVRYSPTVFTGKMMIHCHRLDHEDTGMMSMEYIHPETNAFCSCGEHPPLLPVWAIVVICCGGLLLMVVGAMGGWYWLRRRRETQDVAAAANKDDTQKPPELSSDEEEEAVAQVHEPNQNIEVQFDNMEPNALAS